MATRKFALGLGVTTSLLILLISAAGGQTCPTQSGQATGYASGDASTLSRLTGVSIDTAQYLRLSNRAGNFGTAMSGFNLTSPYWVAFAGGDFNLDGRTDLVLGGRGLNLAGTGTTNLALRLSSGGAGGFGFDPLVYINYSSSFDTYEIRALGTGDYDRDGDLDISALTWAGRLLIFRNSGLPPYFDTDPVVVDTLMTGMGGETTPGAQVGESNIASVDVDGDGDLDLIVGVPASAVNATRGQVAVYVNDGHGNFSWLKPKKDYNPFPTAGRGVSGVAAADFDGDGDVDFWAGSPNSATLEYYRNDGTGAFTAQAKMAFNIPAFHGSCAFLRAGDFDGDGRPDFVVGTDNAANSPGGYVYYYRNTGAAFAGQLLNAGASLGSDLDAGAVGDFDGDSDLDILAASGINNPATCYMIPNNGFPGVYVLTGTVSSKNLLGCQFLSLDLAVVSATIQVQETRSFLTSIVYYLSNTDDQNGSPLWEGPVTPGLPFLFQNPGDFLRWKAVLASSDPTQTPTITSLSVSYDYISKREYSRTSQAVISVDYDPARTGNEQVLYSASFEFPKWRGHLRSWDVTTLDLSPNKGSVLKDILDADALPIADAGVQLRDTPAANRTVYFAYDADADGLMNDRQVFTRSQAALLQNYLQLGIGSSEVPIIIDFVLGVGATEFDKPWKLGDINHSTPKALLPPLETSSMMGAGYDAFKLAHSNRQKLIFAGANDGMLHAFDAVSLNEVWGFIPNNLLSKLKFMRVIDPECGEYRYHEYFVDGTPSIRDVAFADGTWHTVLISGQGPGWGRNHSWYYFALDVTDPVNPRPLWEITDPFMGETWSIPAIVKIASPAKWVALFGSGYDKDGDPSVNIGHHFYCVDIETGAILRSFVIHEGSKEPVSPFGIQNTLPGSPAVVDLEQDGFADTAYFGDLKGRLWRMSLTGDISTWTPTVIYRDPNLYPIISKPAVYVDVASSNTVHVYFGTGGDDRAPNNVQYSFIALIDNKLGATVEWYIGPDALAGQLGISADTKKGSFALGEKVWADPVIANRNIFIATLQGDIESLNPCNASSGGGKIYARLILGSQYGGSSLVSAAGEPIQYLATEQKVRSAVTLGETQLVDSGDGQTQYMRKVFIQSFTQPGGAPGAPPSQVLAQPVVQSGLIIKQWREVYRVYKVIK